MLITADFTLFENSLSMCSLLDSDFIWVLMRVKSNSNGAEVSNFSFLMSMHWTVISIVTLPIYILVSHYAGCNDDDDPNITIYFSTDDVIHLAMGSPERPAVIQLGANPAASRRNLISWIDNIILANVHGVDVMDRDAEGVIVPGSYSGLRAGEWGQVLQALGARDTRCPQSSWEGEKYDNFCENWTLFNLAKLFICIVWFHENVVEAICSKEDENMIASYLVVGMYFSTCLFMHQEEGHV